MATATFTADFSRWDAALKNAQSGLKSFEVPVKGIQQQLQRMANAFSGTQIQKQATLMTSAVEAIGGAAKLTASEQARVNTVVGEAIAKYRALGQQAPADMLKLAAATKQVEQHTSLLSSTASKMGGVLAGAFALGTIGRLAGDVLKFAGDLNDLSAKTGLSVQALQEFKFAGDQVGVTLDDVSTAVLQMQKHLVGGDKSVSEGLKTIGLSFKDLQGLRPEDQFSKIASALSKIEDPAVRNKVAFDLMGKAAASVLPLIASDLDKTREKAREFGVVLDEDTINKLDTLGDTWAVVKLAGEAFIAKAIVPLAPALTQALSALLPFAAKIGELPGLYVKAEIAGVQFVKSQVDNAIAFLSSPVAAITNPIGALTGQTKKQVEDLRLQSYGLGIVLKELQGELDAVGKRASGAKALLAPFNTILGGTKTAADKSAKALQTLRDELTGANILKDLHDLMAAWESLTPVEQANALAVGVVQQKYVDLASKLPTLPPDLRDFAIAMNDAAEKAGLMGLKVGALRPIVESLGPKLDASGRAFRDWGAEVGFEAEGRLIPIYESLGKVMTRLPESLPKVGKITHDTDLWALSLRGVADALQLIMDNDPSSSFGHLVGIIKNLAGAFSNVARSIGDYNKALKAGDTAGQLQAGISLGLTFISVVQQIAAAADRASFNLKVDKELEQWRELGIVISRTQAELNVQTPNSFITQFAESVASAGGVTIDNLNNISKAFDETLKKVAQPLPGSAGPSRTHRGGGTGTAVNRDGSEVLPNIQHAVKEIEELFPELAKVMVESGKVASNEFLGLLKTIQEIGVKTKAVIDFIAQQSSRAGDAMLKVFAETGSQFAGLAEKIAAAEEAVAEARKHGSSSAILKANAELTRLLTQQHTGAEQLGAEVGRLGGFILATFNAGIKSGLSFQQALAGVQAPLERLIQLQKDLGLDENNPALAALEVAAKVTGTQAGQAAAATNEMILALSNIGALTGETFQGVEDQIGSVYTRVQAEIAKAGGGTKESLQQILPSLQSIIDASKEYGFTIDGNTQALIDQAIQLGLLTGDATEKIKTEGQVLQDTNNILLIGIGALVEAVGGELPAAFVKMRDQAVAALGEQGVGGAIAGLPDSIDIPIEFPTDTIDLPKVPSSIKIPIEFSVPRYPTSDGTRQYAHGGAVYAAAGLFVPRGTDTVPAMLTPGEFVVNKPAVDRIGTTTLAAMNSGGQWGASGPVTVVHVTIQAWDGQDVSRVVQTGAFQKALKDAAAKNKNWR